MIVETEVIGYLRRPRRRWVDIEVAIGEVQLDGSIRVESRHVAPSKELLNEFSIKWPDAARIDTEYGLGISLVHDVKDHVFYGLGFNELTEFQTIVQTYYGRAISGSRRGGLIGDCSTVIAAAVRDELYGPRGPRVYGPLEEGLFDLHAPSMGDSDRRLAFGHMMYICLEIMLPALRAVYAANPLLRVLQRSTRDQSRLVDELLPGLRWVNAEDRLLRLDANAGRTFVVRAYVDDDLAELTRKIRSRIREHCEAYADFLSSFGPVFEATSYCLFSSAPGNP